MPRRYSGPLMPGARSAYVKGLRSNRRKKPATKQGLVRLIKNVQLKQCETKRATDYTDGVNQYHNITNYKNNLLYTSQGTAQAPGMDTPNSSRIGDEIIPTGLLLKFHYLSAVERPNVCGVIYLFQYVADQTPDDAVFWRGPAGAGATMNRLIDMPDTNNIRILKKHVIQNRNNYAVPDTHDRVNGTMFQMYYKFPKKAVKYEANGGHPKWKDIGVASVFYDANNTLTTDILGYMSLSHTLYFKDP